MWFKVLVSTACIAVIAASGVVIWEGIGLTGAAQARVSDVTRADICRIMRDFSIANEFDLLTLTPGQAAVAEVRLMMCEGKGQWPPPPYPQ